MSSFKTVYATYIWSLAYTTYKAEWYQHWLGSSHLYHRHIAIKERFYYDDLEKKHIAVKIV